MLAKRSSQTLNDWKQGFLREISKDAQTRGAFPADHFDSNGVLKPFIAEYTRLFRWLVSCYTDVVRDAG